MLYFHSYKSEHPLVIDIVSDIRYLNDMSVRAKKAGMVILGGGVCKHQIANAMLFVRPAVSASRRQYFELIHPKLVLYVHSVMVPTMLCTSIPAKSMMDRTRALGRTRPSLGARSRQMRVPSRYVMDADKDQEPA